MPIASRRVRIRRGAALLLALAALPAAGRPRAIDDSALSNETDGANWAAHRRTHPEQHRSPLPQANAGNVAPPGLPWSPDLPGVINVGSQPLAVDGVIYLAVGLSVVHAVDARTGKLLWRYDPEVAKVAGHKLREAWGSRGLAFWKGRV